MLSSILNSTNSDRPQTKTHTFDRPYKGNTTSNHQIHSVLIKHSLNSGWEEINPGATGMRGSGTLVSKGLISSSITAGVGGMVDSCVCRKKLDCCGNDDDEGSEVGTAF